MRAAALRTVIMKCTTLFYSVVYDGIILYMLHYKIQFFNLVVQFDDCSL
jgi:hypothetical protein